MHPDIDRAVWVYLLGVVPENAWRLHASVRTVWSLLGLVDSNTPRAWEAASLLTAATLEAWGLHRVVDPHPKVDPETLLRLVR